VHDPNPHSIATDDPANLYNLLFLKVFPAMCRCRWLLALIAGLLAAGCAGLPDMPEAPETFVLSGKVGVREAQESFSANLLWHQKGEAFDIDLWGPLGQGRVKLVKKGDGIQLRSDQGVLAEGDADSVMKAHLGWSLPVDVLPAWVQGGPYAGAPVAELARDGEGRFTGFTQLGWAVVLERYETVRDGTGDRDLPTRITATREGARVRLVVSEWRL
jgi:outer membrane lipoprotein LolB